MHVQKTITGLRLLHGGHVVSELLALPGPTNSVFDVLAACVMVCSPGPDAAMLGFAGGGTVAALRALGWDYPLVGVDLELAGAKLFSKLTRSWCRDVSVVQADAAEFLQHSVRCYGAIVEDLSVQLPGGDVQKPDVSLTTLPALIGQRLAPRGVAVLNLLPSPNVGWVKLLRHARKPFAQARLIHMTEYENGVLVGGPDVPSARALGRDVQACLEVLGSELAGTVRVMDLGQA